MITSSVAASVADIVVVVAIAAVEKVVVASVVANSKIEVAYNWFAVAIAVAVVIADIGLVVVA